MRAISLKGFWTATFLFLAAGCATKIPHETLEQPVAVYLLPIGDFPFEFTDQLARRLSAELNIRVRASLPMGIGDLTPLPKDSQFATDDIIARAHTVSSRLRNTSEKLVVIALTNTRYQ